MGKTSLELIFSAKFMDAQKHNKGEASTNNSEQLEALFNNATIGIVVTNNKGEIINFNQHAENQFGYLKEEIIGEPVEILIPHQFSNKHEAYRNSFYHHPQTRMMGAGRDLYAKRKDGSEFPVEISLSPYYIKNEVFVVAFVVDITIRKNAEITLLRQKKELEEKSAQILKMNLELEKKVEDRTIMLKEALIELEESKEEIQVALEKEKELGELKSRFVSMASHEFRTPLTTILSSASLAQKYASLNDKEKHNKHLTKIQDTVKNLTFILEDFLSLGKLEEGLVEVNYEILQPDTFLSEIEEVIHEMSLVAKKGQQFEFTHQILYDISIDKKLLRNILVNLISNAIKYSPENSQIKINTITEDKDLKISVTDYGIGIPEEDQKHLFERFFRAKNAVAIQGTGLGLHIVSRYLQLMNGRIEMESKVNKGTTFSVYIPQH